MKPKRAGILEILAFGVIEAGVLLLLVSQVAKIPTLMSTAILPLVAWMYARLRAPRHLYAVVGAACGLAALPVSHGLFSLMLVLPMPFQLIALLGMIGEALHGFPGNLLATIFHLERRADTSLDTILVDYFFNGIVWAVVYGLLGSHFDRIRHGPFKGIGSV